MKELLLVLLGIGIWQFVVAIIVFSTDDEEKVFKIGIGAIGWIIYALVISFVKIFKKFIKRGWQTTPNIV